MLTDISNQIADTVAAAAPAVVQVHGGGRPASGIVFADNAVLTTVRALRREEGARVRRHDGTAFDGELVGWDPATQVAVLRVPELGVAAVQPSTREPRVGHLGIGVARSWSNAVTASAGLVSVIGGPLPTGHRRAIERVIRTSAPMHEGFTGGAFLDAGGGVIGLVTAAAIRGLRVVIPAPIAWAAGSDLLQHGSAKRGHLGIAVQSVRVSPLQADVAGRDSALLVLGVKPGSPAGDAGLLVGDLLLSLDDQPLVAADDLLELLRGDRVGKPADIMILRGDTSITLRATIRERDSN